MLLLIFLLFLGLIFIYWNSDTNQQDLIELKYDDLYHYQRGKKAYVVFIMGFNSTFDNMEDLFKQRVIKMIKEHKEFRFEKTEYPNKIKKTTKTFEQIYKEITLNEYQPEKNFQLIEKTFQSDFLISLTMSRKNKKLYVCWNHGIIDGLRICEIGFGYYNSYVPYKLNLPTNSNLKTLLCLGKHLISSNPFNKKIDGLIKTEKSTIYNFVINNSEINIIKEKENCSFMGAFQSIILSKLKGIIDKVLVVTAVGVKKTFQFNNVGGIAYHIELSKHENNIGKLVDTKLKKNKHHYMLSTNKYLKMFVKKRKEISLLISSIPISRKDLYFGNQVIKKYINYIPFHTSTIYVFSSKVENKIHVTIGIRNDKVNDYVKKYNWSIQH